MKVLHISTIDVGGAFGAARRLHEALLLKGIESKILLRTKLNKSGVGDEVFNNAISAGISKLKNACNMLYASGDISRDILGTDISNHPMVKDADIIVLHWINSFLTPREIRKLYALGKPILWFMHDMWLFTGGCHVDGYCGRYEYGCGNCRLVSKATDNDITYRNFKDKISLLSDIDNIVVAGPSQWIVECAKKSKILEGKRVICLPNMIDTKVFSIKDNLDDIKNEYGLDKNKKTILFGAADTGTENENKGFKYLLKALNYLSKEDYQLMVFGNTGVNMNLPEGFNVVLCGFVSDESKLTQIYNMADVFVNPSNQESFGYTACEAMACGTPVVAFPIGGLKEQITHMENGYLAKYHDSDDLAKGIMYCANNKQKMSLKAVEAASKYSYQNAVGSYIQIFEELTAIEE